MIFDIIFGSIFLDYLKTSEMSNLMFYTILFFTAYNFTDLFFSIRKLIQIIKNK